MTSSKRLVENKNFTGQEIRSVSNTIINLAEVVNELEKIKTKIQELTDEELYVFDMNGNKVIL